MTEKIDRTATVYPSAHIGAQASIDPGAMVGYLATIGKGARVAEDAIVRVRGVVRAYAILGENSIVGPHADIHAEASDQGTEVVVTQEELEAAIMVAVESIQGAVSDDNQWKRSDAKSVDEKDE